MNDTNELNNRQHQAIAALLSEPTVRNAAATCGLSEATLHRYLHDDAFIVALKDARHDAYGRAIDTLRGSALEAVEALRSVMKDNEAPASSRVSAARSVLDLARTADLEELTERLDELETRMSSGTDPHRRHAA
jgi:hypothetical protein